MANITVSVTDANNITVQLTPVASQTITIDRGVAGNGISSIVPVTISTLQYLRIYYTNGTQADVGPLTSTAYFGETPITIVGNTISLSTVPINKGGTNAITAAAAIQNLLPSYTGNASKRLGLNSGATALEWVADGGGTVTSVAVSGGTTGLTTSGGPITGSGTITLAGTLALGNGGTGQTTAAAAITALTGTQTSGYYLRSNGTNAVLAAISAADVPTLNQNTTGTAAGLSATLAVTSGGTGQSSYAVGDLLYASTTTALSKLADVATGNALISGGVSTAPSWGKIGLTTHVSGTLPTANGGTNLTSFTNGGIVYASSTSALATGSALVFDGSAFAVTGTLGVAYPANTKSGAVFGNGSTTQQGWSLGTLASATSGIWSTADTPSTTNYRLWADANYTIQNGPTYSALAVAASNVLTATSTSLYTASTINVGIGTSLPGAKLEAYTAGTVNLRLNGSLGGGNTVDFYNYIPSVANDGFAIALGGTTRAVINSSGNLGLGVAPSANVGQKTLSIANQTGSFNALTMGSNFTQAGYIGYNMGNTGTNSTWKYISSDSGSVLWFNGNEFRFMQFASGSAGATTSGTQAMTLDASGQRMLGITTPWGVETISKTVDNGSAVATNISAFGGSVSILHNQDDGASGNKNGLFFAHAGSPGVMSGVASTKFAGSWRTTLDFYVNNITGVDVGNIQLAGRFDPDGNLLVGTTSGTSYKLNLKTSSASQSAIGTAGTSGDTAFQAILITKFDNDSTTSQNFIQFQINNGGANCGKITANGANTAAFGSTSDQRVKENIVELPSQLDNIMALRPVEFDYLESYGGGHQIGFIAQEIQQVYPDVISTDDSSEKIMSITGWSKTEARLVKAIQEQQALIVSMREEIEALKIKVGA